MQVVSPPWVRAMSHAARWSVRSGRNPWTAAPAGAARDAGSILGPVTMTNRNSGTALEERLDGLGAGDPDLSSGPELVEALLRKGDRARAVEVDVAFQARARHKGLRWSLARAARSTALLGSDDQLDDLFGRALDLHGEGEGQDAFERARTLMLHGARLRRARRRVDARVPLQEARAVFDALGARRWLEVVTAELEATGLTTRARDVGPVLDLTPRELQIGELLAEGRTTRETAAALFLSPKTVEYHLRHIYTKLDITSRAELRERSAGAGR